MRYGEICPLIFYSQLPPEYGDWEEIGRRLGGDWEESAQKAALTEGGVKSRTGHVKSQRTAGS